MNTTSLRQHLGLSARWCARAAGVHIQTWGKRAALDLPQPRALLLLVARAVDAARPDVLAMKYARQALRFAERSGTGAMPDALESLRTAWRAALGSRADVTRAYGCAVLAAREARLARAMKDTVLRGQAHARACAFAVRAAGYTKGGA